MRGLYAFLFDGIIKPVKEIIITKTRKETERFASRLARQILELKPVRQAVVIGLVGDLGSGKTVFAKGFAKGLGVKEIIASPTFVLEKIYKLKASAPGRSASSEKNYRHLIHIDAYRLENSKELVDLGIKELIRDSRNIILVEWADKIKKILPKGCLKIFFKVIDKNKRKIVLNFNVK